VVFKNLENVLLELIEANVLRREPPDVPERKKKSKLRNETILVFNSCQNAFSAPPEQIKMALVTRPEWEHVMLELTRSGEGAQKLLRDCVSNLPDAGITAFRLGEFVAKLKTEVRAAHAGRNRMPGESVPDPQFEANLQAFIRTIGPDTSYEMADSRDAVLRCIRDRIGKVKFEDGKRDGMLQLLEELEQMLDSAERSPSWSEIARRLGACTSTVWGHFKEILELARDCQIKVNR
jgi:hypothetical protein